MCVRWANCRCAGLSHISVTMEALSNEDGNTCSFAYHLDICGRRRAFVANGVPSKVLKTCSTRTTRKTRTERKTRALQEAR